MGATTDSLIALPETTYLAVPAIAMTGAAAAAGTERWYCDASASRCHHRYYDRHDDGEYPLYRRSYASLLLR